jgi:hypothetical protein
MMFGKMIDMVVWEAVVGEQGICVHWQHSFFSGNIVAGAFFGC